MITQRLIDAYIQGFNSASPNEGYQATVAQGLEAVFDYLTETNQDENGSDVRPEALQNAIALVIGLGLPRAAHPQALADETLKVADMFRDWLTQ